ncbi:SpoIID/LytB domain-containing protein [Pengzhenrongella sp.]|jgi:SpoIID/LytB domain protein|uniref:SpoIID/LytB domain-containing protein n=1 Tax=Pengzhenrongella sp. TaxID=2888820 RepID=UPI002F939BCE
MSAAIPSLARRIALIVTMALTATTLTAVLPAPVAQAAAGDDATFTGHGWGHGRGMGQYGALGYALNYNSSSESILDHFYGGTTAATIAPPEMSVELLAHSGQPLIVTGLSLQIRNLVPNPVVDTFVGPGAVRMTVSGSSVIAQKGPGCSGPWTALGTFTANQTRVFTRAPDTNRENLLRVCEGATQRAYRGNLSISSYNGSQLAINFLPTESYLRGVVPRESPASWGLLGGGKGMQALRAQAVAARSYALSGHRASGARTCDTTSCQVYGGYGIKSGTTWTQLENSLTDTAVVGTAGVVRLRSAVVQRTEFSSSTGGYTAGGTFPAVPDLGDAVSNNPNHNWTTTIPLTTVASSLGTGAIKTIAVTARNGLGEGGGRATQVTVTTSGGTRTFTGDDVRKKLGLKSDWFSISAFTLAEAQSVVKALYADILLRPVDAGGLASWSGFLAGGGSQTTLVASLTTSVEYVRLRVTQAYEDALGREPDPGGLDGWTDAVRTGKLGVDDVQRVFYSGAEFYATSGGTPDGFVTRFFNTALNRSPSPNELSYWTARLAVIGRAGVVSGIWFSYEAALFRAGNYYQLFLKRAPDAAGQSYWAHILLDRGEGAVRIGIAGSMEYRLAASVRFP